MPAPECPEVGARAAADCYEDSRDEGGREAAARLLQVGSGLHSLGTHTVTDKTQKRRRLEGNEKMEGRL